jgi:hypothetical protein
MSNWQEDDPTLLLRLLIDDKEYEEDLRQRARFPERDIEPIFNGCYPPGYKKPRKIRRKWLNPKKEFHRAIRWKQHLRQLSQQHKHATV